MASNNGFEGSPVISLDLSNSNLHLIGPTHIGLCRVFEGLSVTNVTHLNVSGNHLASLIQAEGGAVDNPLVLAFVELARVAQIKYINLANNGLNHLTEEELLALLSAMPEGAEVNLSQNNFYPDQIEIVARVISLAGRPVILDDDWFGQAVKACFDKSVEGPLEALLGDAKNMSRIVLDYISLTLGGPNDPPLPALLPDKQEAKMQPLVAPAGVAPMFGERKSSRALPGTNSDPLPLDAPSGEPAPPK